MFRAPQRHGATQVHFPRPRKSQWHCDITNVVSPHDLPTHYTSVSYETSSKSHAYSLQNERFARDFLQQSHVKSPKRAFRTRQPQTLTCQRLQNERFARDFLQKSSGNTHPSTHTSRSPAKQFRGSSPSKQHPLTRQSQCHSDIHLYHNSQTLRFPAPATNLSAPMHLARTKYCACHEMSPPSHLATSRFPAPATKIALPHLKTRTNYCACHEK